MSRSNTYEVSKPRMPELKVGEKFNSFEVIEKFGLVKRGTSNRTAYKFRCECGTEKILLGTDVYRGRTKSCGCIHECGPEESAFRVTKDSYERNAKKRKLEFHLTDEQLRELFHSPCRYCDSSPNNVTRRKRLGLIVEFRYSGIDRKDNAVGYISSNCVPCCKTCNWMKQKMGVKEFIAHCRRVACHNGPLEVRQKFGLRS